MNRLRMVFPLDIKGEERKIIYIDRACSNPSAHDFNGNLQEALTKVCNRFSFLLLEDNSDTWSHNLKRFTGQVKYQWQPAVSDFTIKENGPLFIQAESSWTCPACRIVLYVSKQDKDPGIRLGIQVDYHGKQELLKLCFRTGDKVKKYIAGCPGTHFERPIDGRELPLHDFVMLDSTALISRDIYAIDSPADDSGSFRMTLLRTPFYAHHTPYEVKENHHFPICEQGEFFFNLTLLENADLEAVQKEVQIQSNTIVFSESTFGCSREYLLDPFKTN